MLPVKFGRAHLYAVMSQSNLKFTNNSELPSFIHFHSLPGPLLTWLLQCWSCTVRIWFAWCWRALNYPVSQANCLQISKCRVNICLVPTVQVIQNAAARLVTGARRSEHMTPVLWDLHWLPIRQRVTFKKAVLAYKCQQGMVPLYLREYCQPLSSVVSHQRRSAHSGRLTVPRTRTNYGDRSFAVQGPRTWNGLPADLRAPDISSQT